MLLPPTHHIDLTTLPPISETASPALFAATYRCRASPSYCARTPLVRSPRVDVTRSASRRRLPFNIVSPALVSLPLPYVSPFVPVSLASLSLPVVLRSQRYVSEVGSEVWQTLTRTLQICDLRLLAVNACPDEVHDGIPAGLDYHKIHDISSSRHAKACGMRHPARIEQHALNAVGLGQIQRGRQNRLKHVFIACSRIRRRQKTLNNSSSRLRLAHGRLLLGHVERYASNAAHYATIGRSLKTPISTPFHCIRRQAMTWARLHHTSRSRLFW